MINGKSHHSDGSLSFEARVQMIGICFSSWLNSLTSLLFGVGYHTKMVDGDVILTTIASGSGGHSLIADVIARYGLIGLMFIFVISKYILRSFKWSVDKNMRYTMCFFFVVLLFNSVFNDINRANILLTIFTLVFLILPHNLSDHGNFSNRF